MTAEGEKKLLAPGAGWTPVVSKLVGDRRDEGAAAQAAMDALAKKLNAEELTEAPQTEKYTG